ncbi:MAG: hypothetical protein K0Q55_1941 [Verrucomicrobia bacterium]|jgi:hypothetical protein|nr:hypothetical protein [Verrucomicrobiota bacterium]
MNAAFEFSPLTPALSPLRGEGGEAVGEIDVAGEVGWAVVKDRS